MEDERRRSLVDRLVARRLARSPGVVRALQDVPRHRFLPDLPVEDAYADRAITLVKEAGVTVSSASQPSMIAEMLEQLAVEPGERVLEIGTGSGYNAALLAHLVGERGSVVTVELDAALAQRARAALDATGYERVIVLHADGAFGAPQFAPFDRIILTVAADDILPAWVEQLAADGRLVLPLTLHTLQESIAFDGPAPLHSVSILGTSFVTLRGSVAAALREITLDSEGNLRLRVRDPAALDRRALMKALLAPPALVDLESQIFAVDVWDGLDLWLDAHLDSLALASAHSEDDEFFRAWLSVSSERPRYAMTLALCDEAGIAFFVAEPRRPGAPCGLRRGRPRDRTRPRRDLAMERTWPAAHAPALDRRPSQGRAFQLEDRLSRGRAHREGRRHACPAVEPLV